MEFANVLCKRTLLKNCTFIRYWVLYTSNKICRCIVFTSLHTSWKPCNGLRPKRAEWVLVHPSCAERPGPLFCHPRQSWLSRTRRASCWWRQTGAENGQLVPQLSTTTTNQQSSSSYRTPCMPSHLTASSSASCRAVRPPVNRVRGQSFTMWLIVCLSAPDLQEVSDVLCQRAWFTAQCPWPVLNRLRFDQRCPGSLKPGGRVVGSSTNEWLVTVVFAHSSIHSHR